MLSDPVAEAFGLIHRHSRVKISAVCVHTSFLKNARCKRFMELGGCLQQELEPGQLWLDIAGESYGSSFEFDGFVLDMDKQEPTPRAGSSRGRQPAEKKSDQRPVVLDQNQSSLISVLPRAMVQNQRQASLTEVKN